MNVFILKIIGGTIIMFASFIIGILLSDLLKKRLRDLSLFINYLNAFENELRFYNEPVHIAFTKLSNEQNSVIKIFTDTSMYMEAESITPEAAWQKALDGSKGWTGFNAEDTELIKSFGKMLGRSDIEGQLTHINIIRKKLINQETLAAENLQKNSKLYKNLSLLIGIAVVIFLL